MTSPRQQRTTIFPLAVTVGLLVFFLTNGMSGGLTGIQGFFAGFGAVFVFSVVVALWPRKRLPTGQKVAQVEDVAIGETGEEITIRIRLDQLGHVQATGRR